jgi:hypothetical protein
MGHSTGVGINAELVGINDEVLACQYIGLFIILRVAAKTGLNLPEP